MVICTVGGLSVWLHVMQVVWGMITSTANGLGYGNMHCRWFEWIVTCTAGGLCVWSQGDG